MDDLELFAALRALRRPHGDTSRVLVIGDLRLRIEGLDRELARDLDRRWGRFLRSPGEAGSGRQFTIRVFRGETDRWLERWRPGERYRLESRNDVAHRVVVSYHLAICSDPQPDAWRLALARDPEEPRERIVENAARYVTALIALDQGGFAMHAAAVLHAGQAWIFAGPSRSGKTTAVGLAAPAVSLGDDYALVVPRQGGWHAPAVPFDNSERIQGDPPSGWFPVAGVWRLHQAERTRVELPAAGLAVASLMGSLAFPWAMPEQADRLLERVRSFVAEGRFAHLHFRRDADLWAVLGRNGGESPEAAHGH